MAEKKEDLRVKAFAVANLNAQKANMRIDIKQVDAREGAIGSKKGVPEVTIKGSPFDHTGDLETLGLKEMWDMASPRMQGKFADKPYEGYQLMNDGLTMTITGDESLKILAEAGVEFPAAELFRGRASKIARGLTGAGGAGAAAPVMV